METNSNALTIEEQKEIFIECWRMEVLNAFDRLAPDGKGWRDSDLTELFKVIDPIAGRSFDKNNAD